MAIAARTDAAASGWRRAAARLQTVPVETWIVGAIVVIGALLRFTTLSSQSFWSDEASVGHQASFSFGHMFSSDVSKEANPPLYFVVTWVWIRLFGSGEFGLRSLSALAGTAVIPIAYLCGRELVSKRAGVVAAVLAAVNPFMIWYSQDATEYMALAAMSAASFLFFARSLRDPSRKNLLWWGVLSALAVLIHFFAIFLLIAEAAWLLYRVPRRSVIVGGAPLVLTVAVLVPLALSHTSASLTGFISETPLRIRIEQVPISFALGTLSKSSLINQAFVGTAVVTAIVAVLLVVGSRGRELRGAGVAALMAAFALFAPLLLALAGHDYFIDRALIPAWVPLAVVIGAACTARRTLPAGMAFGAIVVAAFVYAQVKIERNPLYQRPDWRGVAHALGNASYARAIVVYNGNLAVDPLSYYLPRARWGISPQTVVSVDEVDVVASIYQPLPRSLPPGTKLLGHTTVSDYVADRFRVTPAWRLTSEQIIARAAELAPPAPAPADRNLVFQPSAKP
jgi:Dolichyl-phosphate-mannose-protein mannosyltransferase